MFSLKVIEFVVLREDFVFRIFVKIFKGLEAVIVIVIVVNLVVGVFLIKLAAVSVVLAVAVVVVV